MENEAPSHHHTKSRNDLTLALAFLLIVSIIGNFAINHHYVEKYSIKYPHLAREIAWIESGNFHTVQSQYSVQFQDLRNEMLESLNDSSLKGYYGIYFEDLRTGSWVGINEKDPFISASLLKVPVLVAILKKIENGDLTLDQTVVVAQDDLNFQSGTLANKGAGYVISIEGLLEYLIEDSDNTALHVLQTRFLSSEEILEARLAMGLPVDGDNIVSLGPKHYSNILRSLYYSAYLKRSSSEFALTLLSKTHYTSQLPAGVPNSTVVAHKVGYLYSDNVNHYHDCGIVYHPVKPYILCVMSEGADQAEADREISTLSRIAYDEMDKITKEDAEE